MGFLTAGEWGLPFIGYLPSRHERPSDIFKRLQAKYGKVFCVKMGSRLYVCIADFSLIRSALAKIEFSDRPDFFSFKIFHYFRNSGIVLSSGLVWSSNRKFAIRVLTHFGMGKSKLEEKINVEANLLVQDLRTKVDKPTKIDWNLNVAVLNIIWGLVADKRFNHDDQEIRRFSKMIDENFEFVNGSAAVLDTFPWMIPFMPRFALNLMNVTKIERNRDMLMAYFERELEEHIETFNEANLRDYIDMYLMQFYDNKNRRLSYDKDKSLNLKSSLLNLFSAGSETTATSIRWYILYMAKYPEIQRKIQQEIDSIVPRDRFPSLEDKDNLPYFEASIYESLRIVSLLLLGVAHSTAEDTELAGYKIPKDTVIIPFIEACHRSADYWERPNEFYPEHFINEEGKFYINQEGFLPFSQGRRQCLGESLAKMELFTFTGAILQNFTICEPEGQELNVDPNSAVTFINSPKPFEVLLKAK